MSMGRMTKQMREVVKLEKTSSLAYRAALGAE